MNSQPVNVLSATVDPCGVWNVWESGSLVGKINRDQRHGWAANHRVRHVGRCSVCWIFVGLLVILDMEELSQVMRKTNLDISIKSMIR